MINTIYAEDQIQSLAVSPQENYIAGLDANGSVFIWDFKGNPISRFIHVDVEKIEKNLSGEERTDFIIKIFFFKAVLLSTRMENTWLPQPKIMW